MLAAIPALSVAATENDQTVSDETITTLADTEAAEADAADVEDADSTEEETEEKVPEYKSYLKKYQDSYGKAEPIAVASEFDPDANNTILVPFTVKTKGLYTLTFDYTYTVRGNKNTTYDLMIDGKVPFTDAASRKMARVWMNENNGEDMFVEDADDISPKQVEAEGYWRTITLYDKEGYYQTPLEFYLEPGEHTLSFVMSTDYVSVKNVTFQSANALKSYADYYKEHKSAGVYDGEEAVVVEGEKAAYKSEMYLIAQNDITNPVTQPYSPAFIKQNTVGGANWKLTGETITWTPDVKEAGLYKLSIRFRQNLYDGVAAHRRLYVNGEIPFAEANMLQFPYSTDWQSYTLQDADGNALYLYLEPGDTLSLEVMLGASAKIAEDLQEVVLDMNAIYRDVIMITGSSPDDYRDYNIDEQIPTLVGDLKDATKKLQALADEVALQYGDGSSLIAKIDNIIRQMNQLIEKPKQVAKSDRLGAFKSNISTIGSWISMFCEQPLEIDVIDLYGDHQSPRKAAPDFWEGLGHTYNRFVASFTQDYSSVSGASENASRGNITVWIQSGRDQANVMKQLVTSSFTAKTGIGVNLELVTGAIIEATLAGKGPDVALTRAVTDPVNFAMRDALVDLKTFDDYDEVVQRFTCDDEGNPIAMIPFEYRYTNEAGEKVMGAFALPETQSYQMMFVRTDILEELELGVPTSWDQLLTEHYPIVSRNNMEIGIGNMNAISAMNASNIFTNLLYQKGGQIYNDEGTATDLRSQVAHQAFNQSVELYADYLFPQEYDAMSRFRTGEMPILLADYTMYNVFSISIPELEGLWEMYPIPGVMQEDGTINNVQAATSSASVMFKGIRDANPELSERENEELGWEFLKWWTERETQAEFGNRIEAILGSGGRYATANEAAIEDLPWDDKQLSALQSQMANLVFVEQLPGSYFTSRAINSAFMTSVLNSENPSEQLVYWSEQIDKELTRKLEEFAD